MVSLYMTIRKVDKKNSYSNACDKIGTRYHSLAALGRYYGFLQEIPITGWQSTIAFQ